MKNNRATQERILQLAFILNQEIRGEGKIGGCLELEIRSDYVINVELRGLRRALPRAPEMHPDERLTDRNVIRQHYTVLVVIVEEEVVMTVIWNEHGWFGHIEKGSWEADLLWSFA